MLRVLSSHHIRTFQTPLAARTMSRRVSELDVSPPVHRASSDTLDKSLFRRTISVVAARIPASKTGLFLKADALKTSIMDLPKVKSVVTDASCVSGERLVLFRVSEEADLVPEALTFLQSQDVALQTYQLDLDYDYWTADEILQAFLPEELCEGSPVGFAATGHIAHVNLKNEYLPFKHTIGQLILDKNTKITTVVNKLDSINEQFRFFAMELIAGEPNYVVQHSESDCTFTFDFTQVYWNSRLHTEHERLVELFAPEDVVADGFAGVGPFAIPAAKKGCAVYANDLNPDSAKYLAENVKDNRVTNLVKTYCEDGRDFIRFVVGRALDEPFEAYTGLKRSKTQETKRLKEIRRARESGAADPSPPEVSSVVVDPSIEKPRRKVSHFVMNLPDSAITFLDAFRGLLTGFRATHPDLDEVYDTMPMVHTHCFTREMEVEKAHEDIRQRCEEMLGGPLGDEVSLHLVRSVAPNKDMYCISFRLPREIAYAK